LGQTTPSVLLGLHDDPFPTRTLRAALEDIGARHDLSEAEIFDLKVAATEALTNAMKGSRPRDGVEVAVERRQGVIEVEVRNHGSFELRSPALEDIDAEGGRGIALMFALVDEVEFASTREGTRVRMRKRLGEGRRPDGVAGFSA
jgi:anti-sigma regulatory factor (Ser/Thr protein kinase)